MVLVAHDGHPHEHEDKPTDVELALGRPMRPMLEHAQRARRNACTRDSNALAYCT